MKPAGIFALILSACSGLSWAATAQASQNCSVTMQLNGADCYPNLVAIHNIAGGLTLVLALLGIGLIIAGAAQQPRVPDCPRCGYQAEAHIDGKCPTLNDTPAERPAE